MAQNFGLDFDGTAESDVELWRIFIDAAIKRGHCVFITTARMADDLEEVEKAFPGVEIIPSNGLHKLPACEAVGVNIDVWIDDMPEIIKDETWRPAIQR